MCGIFSLYAEIGELQGRLGFDGDGLTHVPWYNVAPTQPVLAVLNGEGRQAAYLRWGRIPSWAKSASIGNRLINARAETIAEAPQLSDRIDPAVLRGPRRRILCVAAGGQSQNIHADCNELGETLRLYRPLRYVAGPEGRIRQVLHHYNAPMESFLGTLKQELVHHHHYGSREEAIREITEYIGFFYNRQR